MNKPASIIFTYIEHCKDYQIPIDLISTVNPYDDSTLFCPAGMQKYKNSFKDTSIKGTHANIQSCIRMNDLDELDDPAHLLAFDMMGLFSFRDWSIIKAIDFWIEFLERIGLKPDYVTIHPEKYIQWQRYFPKDIDARQDNSCIWTDGEIGGYCTEFFINDIEIGNIVNPLDTCIDVGFGLQRLQMVTGTFIPLTKVEKLEKAIYKIIKSGYKPGPVKQEYVLRKLFRMFIKEGGWMEHPFYWNEESRQVAMLSKYERLKEKHADKTAAWWFDTHGIDVNEINEL